MQIQLGVNQKIKLYNVYRLCKRYISFFKNSNINKCIINDNQAIYRMENWDDFKDILSTIRKIPTLKEYVDNYFDAIPIFIQDRQILEFPESTATKLNQIKIKIYSRMETIINPELFTELTEDLVKLLQSSFIHTVEEPGKGWLRCKGFFLQDSAHDRLICQLVCAVIFKIGSKYLVNNL